MKTALLFVIGRRIVESCKIPTNPPEFHQEDWKVLRKQGVGNTVLRPFHGSSNGKLIALNSGDIRI